MTRILHPALVAAALLAATLPSARAEDLNQEKERCRGSGVDWVQERASCTALIQSGRLNADDLAWAYSRRGFANMVLHQTARAIRDFDEEIRLKPNDADAFGLRSLAEKRLGKDAAAKADLAKACQLDPKRYCD